jgi:methionyl-tRNA formyltransferase
LRLIFAGTPEFAAVALKALLSAGHRIELVLTQPDRPAGRGLKLEASAVKRLAEKNGLALAQPVTLRDDVAVNAIQAVRADAMVVAAYGLILPRSVLALPRLGCLNIHASLLPRWRGAAPIQRAILAGDKESGVTIMQMNEGLDTGDILLRQSIEIVPDETAGSLHDKLAVFGAQLIVRALEQTPTPVPQDHTAATYAAKIDKREAIIRWTDSMNSIERQVRAFNPFPGASTTLDGINIKIWRANALSQQAATPGAVMEATDDRLIVACGEGALTIHEMQRAGGKRLSTRNFLRGFPLAPGARFGA